jgi:excinuclease ABC subunit A
LVVVDRLKIAPGLGDRLADSLGTCFAEGEGEAVVLVARDADVARRAPRGASKNSGGAANGSNRDGADTDAAPLPHRLRFTERFRCPDHPDITFLDPTPQLFSFNNPYGTCPLCTGFGATLDYDENLIIPNPRSSCPGSGNGTSSTSASSSASIRVRARAGSAAAPASAPRLSG